MGQLESYWLLQIMSGNSISQFEGNSIYKIHEWKYKVVLASVCMMALRLVDCKENVEVIQPIKKPLYSGTTMDGKDKGPYVTNDRGNVDDDD